MRKTLLFVLASVPLALWRAFPPEADAVARFIGLLLTGFAAWTMIRHWLRAPLAILALLLMPPDWALLVGLWALFLAVLPFASRNRGLPILSFLAGGALLLHPSGLVLIAVGAWRVWGTWANKTVALLAFLSLPGWMAPGYLLMIGGGCLLLLVVEITLHRGR